MQNLVYSVGTNLPETIFDKEFGKGYGTLSFNIPNIEEEYKQSKPLLFHIYVDVSGSMADIIEFKQRRSKIQLIKHTLVNILHHLAEQSDDIYIILKGFDNIIHDYISAIKVTKDNIQELLSKVEQIRPMGSTNIGLALQSLNIDIDTDYSNIPIENRVAILLTDGEPTAGICNIPELVEIISKKCSHHFIGLGNEHNGKLLLQMGHKNVHTTNWFISDIEHTGNVYGEILFNETHRVLNNIKIRVLGGKIYDFDQGIFVDHLEVGSLYEETTKNYHICIENEDQFDIVVSGNNLIEEDEFTLSATKKIIKEDDFEITKQYLRLCVQKLMFRVRQEGPQHEESIFDKLQCYQEKRDIDDNIITDINTFYDFITKYVKDNGLNTDNFMIELIKDINVMKNSYKTVDGYMYVSAREDSQGRQTAFNTASKFEYDLSGIMPPKLKRETTSAYKTPRRCELMRNISNSTSSQLDEDDEPMSPYSPGKLRLFHPNTLSRKISMTVQMDDIETDVNH